MTGYELSRKIFDFAFEEKDCGVYHISIFLWIVELNNRLGWKKEIGVPSYNTCEGLSIGNKNTYLSALRDLEKWGFIKIIKESKNQFSATIIEICRVENDTATSTALDIALIQQGTQHGYAIDPIDKQVNKETNKPYKTKDNKTKEEVKEEVQKFIEHWNKIFLEKREVTEKLEEKYLKIRKEHTKEEFIKGYNLYKDAKLKVKKEKGEFMFLLSPLAFLTQANGFISYL